MLYSYKNGYPDSIPYRIRLSNGLTRTDPTTFTEAEIEDAGYMPVADPPTISNNEVLSWNGFVWEVRNKTSEELQADLDKKIAEYDAALTNYLDSVAQQKKYDNRITCALRAGYAGPFQQEGTAYGVWMDQCNAQAYQILDQVTAGQIPTPTIEEFLAMLPTFTWPT